MVVTCGEGQGEVVLSKIFALFLDWMIVDVQMRKHVLDGWSCKKAN